MATSGAKPQVISLSTRSRRTDPSAAGATVTSVERPDHLSREGGPMWDLIAPDLVKLRLLRESDLPFVVELCEALGLSAFYRRRVESTKTELADLGPRIEAAVAAGDHELEDRLRSRDDRLVSALKRNTAGWRDSVTIAARLAAELGLGPVTRIRTGLTAKGAASLLEGLQEAAGGGPN